MFMMRWKMRVKWLWSKNPVSSAMAVTGMSVVSSRRQAALVRRDGYADLERIACPALVVACRQDRLRSFAETERMARSLPRAHFEVIEDCGHMAPLERPRELGRLLAAWISREAL